MATILLMGLALPSVSPAQPLIRMGEVVASLRSQLTPEAAAWANRTLDWPRLRAFYGPDALPNWIDRHGPSRRAEQWRAVLQAAETEGLDPEAYGLSIIQRQWDARSPKGLAWLDLLLTDAFFRYSVHVRAGRLNSNAVDPGWHIAAPEADPAVLLRSTLAADDMTVALRSVPPPHQGYQRLRAALARYRRLAQEGAWPTLSPAPTLKFGIRHKQVRLLRRRLQAEGDLLTGPVADAEYFDRAVKDAVERFQIRHGLSVDGEVDVKTRTIMNIPVMKRIEQIKLNMERWRWLPRQLGKRHVLVNTASYELVVMEDDQVQFDMRVITGRPDRPTPVIGGKLTSIVFNPFWHVPRIIAVKDLLPKQQQDPNFFASRGIRVFSYSDTNNKELDPTTVDWSRLSKEHFPYRLRQDPGPKNAMGRVKFKFGNAFDVYLHDTPQRRLFDKEMRAFSSGCIRVQKPMKLVTHLLRGKKGWTETHINTVIAKGETQTVALPELVPIYLLYLTAWVGPDQAVYFREDVYQRDRPLLECS